MLLDKGKQLNHRRSVIIFKGKEKIDFTTFTNEVSDLKPVIFELLYKHLG